MDIKEENRANYRGYQRPPIATVPHDLPTPHAPAREEPPPKKRRVRKPAAPGRGWIKYAAAILLVALIAWLAYGYFTTKNQLEQAKSGGGTGQTETQQLVNQVGRLVQLPQNETPTIATVNNASKLQNQAFFKDAQNGDKVLIYSKSGKAVLYRPSTNKIVEYSTVNLTGT